MRKLFTFLCAALMSVGSMMADTTVTWGASEFSSFGVDYLHDSRTVKGITVTVNAATNNFINVTEYGTTFNATIDNAFTFSTELGNITKIECTTLYANGTLGDGWTIGANSATWEGNTNTLNFGNAGSMLVVSNIIFTIGDAAPEPAGTVVTWNNPSGYGFEFTQDGVTLTCGEIVYKDFYGTGTFTTDLGNFTKIEVYAEYGCLFYGEGWSGDDNHKTWTGNAAIVSFSNDIYAPTSIVFTIEPASTPEPEPEPEPEPAGEVTVVFAANNNTVERTVTLPHTFKCDWAGGMERPDELDIIIHELYNDYFYCNSNMNASGSDQVEAGTEEDPGNDYITIKGVFEGTATVTGNYLDYVDDNYGEHNYSITISIKGDEPEPEPAPVTDPITPYADPQDASVYYSTFYDHNFKYALPDGVEAYVATRDGANLLLSQIAVSGQTIPADNAVILKSTVTSFTLTVSDADAVTFTATNDLQGSDTQIATPANCYVLAGTDGVVGFYHYTAANLNAHKAYVVYSGSNQAPRRMPFIFDQATGVENVQGDNVQSTKVIENGVLYIIKNGVKFNAQGQIVK